MNPGAEPNAARLLRARTCGGYFFRQGGLPNSQADFIVAVFISCHLWNHQRCCCKSYPRRSVNASAGASSGPTLTRTYRPGYGFVSHSLESREGVGEHWILGRLSFGSVSESKVMRSDTMRYLPLGSEHRWGERVRVDLAVEVFEEGRPVVGGCLKNLSLSGALLKSCQELRLNALIGVRIEILAPDADSHGILARVARKPNHGIGLEWCEFAPAVVKDLLRLQSARFPPRA